MTAPAPIAQSRPMRTSGPITALAAMTVPVPISARGPIDRAGIDGDAALQPRLRVHVRAGRRPRRRRATTAAARAETASRATSTKAR